MARISQRQSGSVLAVLFTFILSIVTPVNALYFYLDSTTPKCFFEELPKDTLVVGKWRRRPDIWPGARIWVPKINSSDFLI